MKEFRGTPGEWTVLAPDMADEDRPRYHWTIRAPGPGICISFQLAEMSSINRPEDEHDARLMAASKDLLEALQEAIKILGEIEIITGLDEQCMTEAYREAKAKMRAAVTKALGS